MKKFKFFISLITLLFLFLGLKILFTLNKEIPTYPFLVPKEISTVSSMPKDTGILTIPDKNLIVNGNKIKNILNDNLAIYNKTREITSNCTTDLEKAQAIYVWIATNISYDYSYLDEVLKGHYNITYGSATDTFKRRSAVCVGFSTLYFEMAKDAGLNVELIMGQGLSDGKYSGHMWNKVYIESLNKWVNVDTTFASSYVKAMKKEGLDPNPEGILSSKKVYKTTTLTKNGTIKTFLVDTANYFNSKDFDKNHKDPKVIATYTQ